ncbi:membrane protein [Oleiphilus messinensis]|uniref:Membrane protein n=1 Tax=Oleiphilus messinensis TaxID=141451 RepID=A0A1Y0IGT7_9GAMM|nr:membrane protein [Oleiphilus messinensis]
MYLYRLVFLLILSIYVFSPVIMDWWIDPGSSWYRPYLIWLFIIGLSYWLEQRRDKHEL